MISVPSLRTRMPLSIDMKNTQSRNECIIGKCTISEETNDGLMK